MSDALYAIKKETSYENFVAWCPYCGFKNIFNRVSDLGTVDPIGFEQVCCFNEACGKPFNINGDTINPSFHMLVFDCYDLKQEKRYSYCILNLAQAYEVFFSMYLRVELLYKPFCREGARGLDDLDRLNELAALLYKSAKKYAFVKLRNIFTNRVLIDQPVNSFDEAEKIIGDLDSLTQTPADTAIDSATNTRLSKLLKELKDTKVRELRNKVVHQSAYRPSIEEVEAAIEETRKTLFPLAQCLGIQTEDINWYMTRA